MKFMEVVIHRNEEATEFWTEIIVGKLPAITSNKVGTLHEALTMTGAKLAGVGEMMSLMDALEDTDHAH